MACSVSYAQASTQAKFILQPSYVLQTYFNTCHNAIYSTLITSIQAITDTTKNLASYAYKVLCSIRIHVLSDSCYYHITPFSVQYPIFMNDIPDTYHCKSNQYILLYSKTPFDNIINLFHESQCKRAYSFYFCQMFLFKFLILLRCHFLNLQCHLRYLWNTLNH